MTETQKIWVIDDDRSIRWVLERALKQAGMSVKTFDSAEGVLDKLAADMPAAIISDVRMPGIDGLQLLEMIGERYPDLPVIIMTAHSDLDSAVSAYQGVLLNICPSLLMWMKLSNWLTVPSGIVICCCRGKPATAPAWYRMLHRKLLVKQLPCRRCFVPSGGWRVRKSLC